MKVLVTGTSHAADCAKALQSHINQTAKGKVDVQIAVLQEPIFRRVLLACEPVPSADGRGIDFLGAAEVKQVCEGKVGWTGKLIDRWLAQYAQLSTFDAIIAVDMFYHGSIFTFLERQDHAWLFAGKPVSRGVLRELEGFAGTINGDDCDWAGGVFRTPPEGKETGYRGNASKLLRRISEMAPDAKRYLVPSPYWPSDDRGAKADKRDDAGGAVALEALESERTAIAGDLGWDFLAPPRVALEASGFTKPEYSIYSSTETKRANRHMSEFYWRAYIDQFAL